MSIFSKLFGKQEKPSMASAQATRLSNYKNIENNPYGIMASYDFAGENNHLSRAWANVKSGSADQLNTKSIRKLTRDRCRDELANNPYATGMANTLVSYTIASGVKLNITSQDSEFNAKLEKDLSDSKIENQKIKDELNDRKVELEDCRKNGLECQNRLRECINGQSCTLQDFANYLITKVKEIWESVKHTKIK